MSVELSRLSNGLTVVTDRNPHLESASLGIWVRVGSRSETLAQHGITHVLEHMAFKGTTSRTARAIAEEIEAVGGELNASTSVEQTAYYARVLKEDVPLVVDILSDIMLNSVFDPKELMREKHVILQEIGAAHDSPDDCAFDLFQKTVWPDQAIGRPILGTPDSVSGFTPEAIRGYMAAHYRAPDLVLAAAGAVDHDQIVKLAEQKFSGLSPEAGEGHPAASYGGGEALEKRDLQEAQILLGFEGLSYRREDYYASQILASVLGGGMSSRLFQEVREERGLCYAIYSFHWAFADTGVFAIHAATGEEDLPELMPVILNELQKASLDISDDEVARARAQIRASLMMALESPAARAGQIARQVLIHGRVLDREEIVTRIEAVSAADLRDLSARVFMSGTPTLTAIGPIGNLMSLDEIRLGLGIDSPTVASASA